jgi:hypothetical protein
MRDLDRFATRCLREAARKKRKLVERDLLPRVFSVMGSSRTRALAAAASGPAAGRRQPPSRRCARLVHAAMDSNQAVRSSIK